MLKSFNGGYGYGIPTLVIDGTSNNEIFNSNGYIFKDKTDVIHQLEKLINNYQNLKIEKRFLDETTNQYYNFFQDIIKDEKQKKISLVLVLELFLKYFYFKMQKKLKF